MSHLIADSDRKYSTEFLAPFKVSNKIKII